MIHDLPTWLMAVIIAGAFVGTTVAAVSLINRLWPIHARHEHNDIAGFLIAVGGLQEPRCFGSNLIPLALRIGELSDAGSGRIL